MTAYVRAAENAPASGGASAPAENSLDQSSTRLPMVEIYLAMMKASATATAGRLGLFGALADGALDVDALARKIGASLKGVEALTDFLVALGYLERRGAKIANAPVAADWFAGGALDYAPGLVWTADAWSIMGDLPNAVRLGRPERSLWDRMAETPELGADFSRYMRAFAEHLSPDLLAIAGLPAGDLRLLDLGGSHGSHAIAFCRHQPGLEAVIVDLDSALTETAARIEAEGLEGRITVRPGDIRSCDWGRDYDIALYLSVAHNMSVDDNRKIFRHLANVIRPGGQLVIHDYPRGMTPAIYETAFRLTLLVETGTRTLSFSEIDEMLSDAGFAVRRIMILTPAEKGTLIVATRR